jgi:hypothetical protein
MRKLALMFAVVLLSGCYHAQINTGLAASPQVIEKPWAMSFVYGLIPPPVTETAAQCPRGVSKVETRISLRNGLVAGLSFSLVTPMEIKVTCAH